MAEEKPAGGTKGVLCKSAVGDYFFRVYATDGTFTDYSIRHDELEVTISADEMASFFRIGDDYILDHSSSVLALDPV